MLLRFLFYQTAFILLISFIIDGNTSNKSPMIRISVTEKNGAMIFQTRSRTVDTKDGRILDLSPKEYKILEYLLLKQGIPVSAEELIEHIWKEDFSLFAF